MTVKYTVVSAPHQKGGPSEDAFCVSDGDGEHPFFAVVVDGHGTETDERGVTMPKSEIVARYARAIAQGLREQFERTKDPSLMATYFDLVARSTDATYRTLVETPRGRARLSVGAVASCVVVTSTQIHLFQTGDCRLYGSFPDRPICRRLSQDHNGRHNGEIARIRPFLRRGVLWWEDSPERDDEAIARLFVPKLCRRLSEVGIRVLSPTRAFGDWEFHPAVIHEPERRTFELSKFASGDLFALCSDGGNGIVEAIFENFKGRTQSTPLDEIAAFASTLTHSPGDDVTIVFFRQVK